MGFAGMVELEPVFAVRLIFQEIAATSDAEEVGIDEVHGYGKPEFMNIHRLASISYTIEQVSSLSLTEFADAAAANMGSRRPNRIIVD